MGTELQGDLLPKISMCQICVNLNRNYRRLLAFSGTIGWGKHRKWLI